MIEKWIKNELTLKRYRRFKSHRAAVFSLWAIIVVSFFSFTAEFWANSKPLVLSYKGVTYFPVIKDYHPTEFGRTDIYEMDYKNLQLAEGDWAMWPIVHWDPYEYNKNLESYPSGPSKLNILGTDDRGRDVLSRLLYGFRYSFAFAVLVWLTSFSVGICLGSVMGYLGGWSDLLGQRVVEIFETVPKLLLLITVISIFQPSMLLLVTFMTVFGWMFITMYVRAEFLKLRKREFTEAARAIGASEARIIFKHILPNALSPVITFSPFIISAEIVGLANLDYLGLGLRAPTPSWGELLSQAKNYFTVAWWLAVFPSLALFFTLTFLNIIGESVRDALDPKKV